MATDRKEHLVIETDANGRTTWKSVPGSAVAFYASADDGLNGAAELHAAAAEAFGLEGDDRVLVVNEGCVLDVVSVKSPEKTRRAADKHFAEIAADLAARKAKQVAA